MQRALGEVKYYKNDFLSRSTKLLFKFKTHHTSGTFHLNTHVRVKLNRAEKRLCSGLHSFGSSCKLLSTKLEKNVIEVFVVISVLISANFRERRNSRPTYVDGVLTTSEVKMGKYTS